MSSKEDADLVSQLLREFQGKFHATKRVKEFWGDTKTEEQLVEEIKKELSGAFEQYRNYGIDELTENSFLNCLGDLLDYCEQHNIKILDSISNRYLDKNTK